MAGKFLGFKTTLQGLAVIGQGPQNSKDGHIGGLIEAVVDGETGWICSRSDRLSLAETLADFAAAGWPECRRRGVLAAQLARERFGWPEIARRTSELYGEVLAGD